MLNNVDKFKYLEKNGWSYCGDRKAQFRWRAPKVGSFHSFTEAYRIQKSLETGEMTLTKCRSCNVKHFSYVRFEYCRVCKMEKSRPKKC